VTWAGDEVDRRRSGCLWRPNADKQGRKWSGEWARKGGPFLANISFIRSDIFDTISMAALGQVKAFSCWPNSLMSLFHLILFWTGGRSGKILWVVQSSIQLVTKWVSLVVMYVVYMCSFHEAGAVEVLGRAVEGKCWCWSYVNWLYFVSCHDSSYDPYSWSRSDNAQPVLTPNTPRLKRDVVKW